MSNPKIDLSDKVCLVTGASAGIGRAIATGLAHSGAAVVMLCRNRQKSEPVLAETQELTGNDNLHLLIADLSSQRQVREAVATFRQQFDRLHVLINNAGVILPRRQTTEDGLEMQFAVNYLAHFLLTRLLLDVLIASQPARIINLSSSAHHGARLDFSDLQSERAYNANHVYARTKLANILFTRELARRLKGTKVTAHSLTPGVVATRMLDEYMGVRNAAGATPEEGARTAIYLATAEEAARTTGRFWSDCRPVQPSAEAQDDEVAAELWRVSSQLCGLTP